MYANGRTPNIAAEAIVIRISTGSVTSKERTMFIDANELKQNLFERGYSVGTFDAERQHTGTDFQITIRIQAAQYIARYDAWSQGYLAGYDKRSSELSASTAAHGGAGE